MLIPKLNNRSNSMNISNLRNLSNQTKDCILLIYLKEISTKSSRIQNGGKRKGCASYKGKINN